MYSGDRTLPYFDIFQGINPGDFSLEAWECVSFCLSKKLGNCRLSIVRVRLENQGKAEKYDK